MKIFTSIEPDGSINYSKTDGKLTGPDQDRGALEGALWAIVPFMRYLINSFDGWTKTKAKALR